jgi:hypothetical protein
VITPLAEPLRIAAEEWIEDVGEVKTKFETYTNWDGFPSFLTLLGSFSETPGSFEEE